MGFRAPVKRSTLADANEARDWRIWEDLATLLIRHARKLYCNDYRLVPIAVYTSGMQPDSRINHA